MAKMEQFRYQDESPQSRAVFKRYLDDVERGKSILQLKAVSADITPDIRWSWSPRSFTPIQTSDGHYDEIVCNIAYHYHKHGQKYGSVKVMTDKAMRMFREQKHSAKIRSDGLLQFPDGSLFENTGKIVTFVG